MGEKKCRWFWDSLLLLAAVFMRQYQTPVAALKCNQCRDERLSHKYYELYKCSREVQKPSDCRTGQNYCSTLTRRVVGLAEVRYVYRCEYKNYSNDELKGFDEHLISGAFCQNDGCNNLVTTWWTYDNYLECYQCSNVERFAKVYGYCYGNNLKPRRCPYIMENLCMTIRMGYTGYLYMCVDEKISDHELNILYPNYYNYSSRYCDAFGCNIVSGRAISAPPENNTMSPASPASPESKSALLRPSTSSPFSASTHAPVSASTSGTLPDVNVLVKLLTLVALVVGTI